VPERTSTENGTTAVPRLLPDAENENKSQLNQWFSDVSQSGLVDLQRVAAGMEADATAIHEAIISRWSNGVVEGHVNRLKMLKRQMYGRAGFELLRRRVMCPLA
jgi:transposase